MAGPSRTYDLEVRVTFSDTDAAGIIYYGRYFTFMEQDFLGLMKAAGFDYYRVDREFSLLFPAVEANCRYLSPARYDNLLSVKTWLSQARGAHLRFESEILAGETPIARGFTRHACVDKESFRITRIPKPLLEAFAPYLAS